MHAVYDFINEFWMSFMYNFIFWDKSGMRCHDLQLPENNIV